MTREALARFTQGKGGASPCLHHGLAPNHDGSEFKNGY